MVPCQYLVFLPREAGQGNRLISATFALAPLAGPFTRDMDYIKEYRSFISSHYLSQGIRVTAGIALPAILFNYFHLLSVGILVSLGAMAVSITDLPGPIHHRRNGMLACTLIIFLVTLLTCWQARSPIGLGILIIIFCFFFSMIGVYGARAGSVGLAALLVMVLMIDHPARGLEAFSSAYYVAAGGLWYSLLSLVLYSIRPYRLAQQALGECIQATAAYLATKAAFYEKDPDYDQNYRRLLEQQTDLHQKQELIRELLFKSRKLVKESNHTSRILVMIFLDTVDLFERVMASQQDMGTLHRLFDGFGILPEFRKVILEMAAELEEIGIAVKSGRPSQEISDLPGHIKQLENDFVHLRDSHRDSANVEGFIGLRHILQSIQDIAERLDTLRQYSSYDRSLAKKFQPPIDYEQFISHQGTDLRLFQENLSLSSNSLRHALRVCIATGAGYLISSMLPFGHSYWILLTIIVILKPAYSLTKKRNYERLLGTVAGALIGIGILLLIKDNAILLLIMILLMIGTYSFSRTYYLVSVLFMTPYILLLFHLLAPHDVKTIVIDRLIDTGIGSGIAFLANILILPAWEHEQIQDYMIKIIEANKSYFIEIAAFFSGQPGDKTAYKLSRKITFVSLANLSDAFNRMLSEPKSKQKNIRSLHQFVVLNHMLTSHIATLSYYGQRGVPQHTQELYLPVSQDIQLRLSNALAILQRSPVLLAASLNKQELRTLSNQVNQWVNQRKSELQAGIVESETRQVLSRIKPIADQFNFINKIAIDLEKLCRALQGGGGQSAARTELTDVGDR